jgi:urease accessory protein
MDIKNNHLTTLMAWFSPGFPVGGFAYSHGLEAAIDNGIVDDKSSLAEWLRGALFFGSPNNDAIILKEMYEATIRGDYNALKDVSSLALTLNVAKELTDESIVQGNAFWRIIKTAWPHSDFISIQKQLPKNTIVYPAAVAIAAAKHDVPVLASLLAYLQAFVMNGVSAGIRLGLIGQTDGQVIITELQSSVFESANQSIVSSIDNLGTATLMIDLMSIKHETQTTRLFRS